MAITTPNYTGLTAAMQDPYGGFAPPGPYPVVQPITLGDAIYDLPNRLRGMELDRTLKTATYTVSDWVYAQHGNDASFRDSVKRSLADELASEAVRIARFTQTREPQTGDVKVIARVVIMTEDQLKKLIQAAR